MKLAGTTFAVFLFAASSVLAQSNRYLYVLTCDARVSKVDTVLDRQVSLTALKADGSKKQVIPYVQPNETLDGCLANHVIFDAKASVFYTVVPEQARLKADGAKDYQMVGFRIPTLAPTKVLPAGKGLTDPPHLQLGVGGVGEPTIVSPNDWAPQTDLDLSTFAPDKQQSRNQILEESGDKVLLRIFSANEQELVLAIADRRAKSLVKISGLISTTAKDAHLSPGGEAIWVEGTNDSGTKTGNALLYSSTTGQTLQKFANPLIEKMSFLAISPNGKAIYHTGQKYGFLNLGRKFSGGRVHRLIDSDSYPPFFFAAK